MFYRNVPYVINREVPFHSPFRSNKETLEINHGDIKIVQDPKVTYLGCILDSYMSGEAIATKVMGKVNGRLKFLHRKSSFLTYTLRRMLRNALIQPHFDYAASAWYPNLTKTFAKKCEFVKINVSIFAFKREKGIMLVLLSLKQLIGFL